MEATTDPAYEARLLEGSLWSLLRLCSLGPERIPAFLWHLKGAIIARRLEALAGAPPATDPMAAFDRAADAEPEPEKEMTLEDALFQVDLEDEMNAGNREAVGKAGADIIRAVAVLKGLNGDFAQDLADVVGWSVALAVKGRLPDLHRHMRRFIRDTNP